MPKQILLTMSSNLIDNCIACCSCQIWLLPYYLSPAESSHSCACFVDFLFVVQPAQSAFAKTFGLTVPMPLVWLVWAPLVVNRCSLCPHRMLSHRCLCSSCMACCRLRICNCKRFWLKSLSSITCLLSCRYCLMYILYLAIILTFYLASLRHSFWHPFIQSHSFWSSIWILINNFSASLFGILSGV